MDRPMCARDRVESFSWVHSNGSCLYCKATPTRIVIAKLKDGTVTANEMCEAHFERAQLIAEREGQPFVDPAQGDD